MVTQCLWFIYCPFLGVRFLKICFFLLAVYFVLFFPFAWSIEYEHGDVAD